jgi:signal transduction histidine kinase
MEGSAARDSAARWTAGTIAVASVALIAAGMILAFLDRHRGPSALTNWDPASIVGDIEDLTIPVIGYVIASRRPRNPIGWLGLAACLDLAATTFASSYGLRALVAAPGSLPGGHAMMWIANAMWIIPIAAIAFVFLLFPTGRLRSRRWRPAAGAVGVIFGFILVASMVSATADFERPFTRFSASQPSAVLGAEMLLAPVGMLLAVVALSARFVLSKGEERLQLKWFAAAAVLVILAFIPDVVTGSVITGIAFNVAALCANAAIAIAVLKYRLYDIDLVISKALQYGALAVFITAVYAVLVAGVGAGVGDQHSVWLSALAAAVVAVAFQPVRQLAARLASRAVYGRRATPYQVLSEFARRIGGTYADEDVLPQMARMVSAGTGALRVVVWLRVGDELQPGASAGDAAREGEAGPPAPALVPAGRPDPAAGGPLPAAGLPLLPGSDMSVPISYRGDLLGAITIQMPRDEPLRPAGAQLVADVAAQAGPVLSNAGLIAQLRASRQRLVTAQDEARRRLERNLHDGAQQDLVALAINLKIATAVVGEDPAMAREMLLQLQADTAGALENLRDLARGIYPPLLADMGLAAALSAQARKSPLPVTIQADGIGRLGQDAEAAIYFCCLEALQNSGKYSRAAAVTVTLTAQDGTVRFSVSDDGDGYDAARTPMGAGLRNMSDRLAALGGTLEVRSAPSAGTTVTGHLPLPCAVPVTMPQPG